MLEDALNGLSPGLLGEIVPARPSDAAAAAGFALALALRAAAARPAAPLVWIVEDMTAREIGLPYGRGLAAAGLDPARLALVRSSRPRETLWATEEALKISVAAVIAESWMAPHHYGLTASRRLLLAARRGGGAGLLVLPAAAGAAARLASAAALRFEIAARPPCGPRGALYPSAALSWRLRLAKARAGPAGVLAIDPQQWRDVAFDPDAVLFRHALPDPALPLRLPAPPCHRSAFALTRRAGA